MTPPAVHNDVPAVAVAGLSKSFTHHLRGGLVQQVLDGVDLDLVVGTMTAITGPSGSGKSSLLRCLYRTYLADSGSIQVHVGHGRVVEVTDAADRDLMTLRHNHLAMVSQFLSVVPRRSAVDLVIAEGDPPRRARERLLELGLSEERVDDPPASFSGGERQIVNIALALTRLAARDVTTVPPVLLLDEATASLDPVRRQTVLDTLADIKHRGATILAVFHDVPDRPGLIDRVLTVQDRRLVDISSGVDACMP